MGMFTERDDAPDERFAPRPYARGGIVSERPVPNSGVRPAPPSGEGETRYLEGLHRNSGEWIRLLRVESEDHGEDLIRFCHSKTQPAPKKISINFDDFSVFRINPYFTIRRVI